MANKSLKKLTEEILNLARKISGIGKMGLI